MSTRKPNCIYVGPGKTGSTWLFEFFKIHPDVFVTPAKDLYFFDVNFGRGMPWYEKQFSGAKSEEVVAEICHDYIVSEEAPGRIAKSLPGVKLMMFLREPVERSYSAFLYRVKHGVMTGTFGEAMQEHPQIFRNSFYADFIRVYLEHFDAKDILLFAFDDLKEDPQGFADQICDRLSINRIEIPDSMQKPALKAAKARFLPAAKLVKAAAVKARQLGLVKIVGVLKSNRVLRRFLYRDYSDGEMPTPSIEESDRLRKEVQASVHELDAMMGTDFCKRWGY